MNHNSYKPCRATHKTLPLLNGVVAGGSCIEPIGNYDIYIGLDKGMAITTRHLPFTDGYELHYPLVNMGVPNNLELFTSMINWIIEQLELGKKIHIGCIGGHGRTGLVLAVLVRLILDEKDAITWVRANYCQKAVESKKQVDWLKENFGITPVEVVNTAYGMDWQALIDGKPSNKSRKLG